MVKRRATGALPALSAEEAKAYAHKGLEDYLAPEPAPNPTAEEREAMTDEQHAAFVKERLARFGDRAGRHGPLAACTRPVMLRLSRDADIRANALARRLGTRKSTWIAQLVSVASWCHPDDWYRAVAAFQTACKGRSVAELAEVGYRPDA